MLLLIVVVIIALILGMYYYLVNIGNDPKREIKSTTIKNIIVSIVIIVVAIVFITRGITIYITIEGLKNENQESVNSINTEEQTTDSVNTESSDKIGVYTIDKDKTKQLKEYLEANYAKAEWYPYIKDVKVVIWDRHYSAFIYTNLNDNDTNVNEQLKILKPAYDIIHNWDRIGWIYVYDKYNYLLRADYDDKVLNERIQDQIKAND